MRLVMQIPQEQESQVHLSLIHLMNQMQTQNAEHKMQSTTANAKCEIQHAEYECKIQTAKYEMQIQKSKNVCQEMLPHYLILVLKK